MIEYLEGDATITTPGQNTIIAHIVNNAGFWGAGFTHALDRMAPRYKKTYLSWWTTYHEPRGTCIPSMLGMCLLVESARFPGVAVLHMCAQDGISYNGEQTVDYEALQTCLSKLNQIAQEQHAHIQMPRIGAGLGGGNWETIKQLIEHHLQDVPTQIYTLKHVSTT